MTRSRPLDAALARALRDGVIDRSDLEQVAGLRVVRRAPEAAVGALDAYGQKLEPSAYDRFAAFKGAVGAPGGGVSALDLLAGRTSAPRALPAWYPRDWDLARAAVAVKSVLLAQGEPRGSFAPGAATKLVFTDADLTLLKTQTPTYLTRRATGERLRDPETGLVLRLGLGPTRNAEVELAALKARHPGVCWDAYALDYSEYASLHELLATPPIADGLRSLERSDRDPASRDFVLTARGQENTAANVGTYLSGHGVDINGVLAVNAPSLVARLDLDRPELTSARKKAVVMAAVITAYDAASVERVKLLDDTDDNLIAGIELLPRLFPAIAFGFYDVLNEGGGDEYRHTLIARTTPLGALVDARGRPLSLEAIERYRSRDQYPAIG